LSRSRRTDQPDDPERFFSFDQTHVLALVLGVNLPLGFRIGGRFRYATGNPYTPLKASYYDAAADVYVPGPDGAPLSERLPEFIQLDLRVDKEFIFDSWRMKIYLELNNATNQANVERQGYNFNFSQRQDIVSLPIQPSLGIRGSF